MSNILALLEKVKSDAPGGPEEEVQVPTDKLEKAYELWVKKIPVINIAKWCGVSEATIYRWIDKHKATFDAELMGKPRSELLLDSLRFLRVVRDVSMSQVHEIDLNGVKVMPDGSVQRNPDAMDLKAKGSFLKLALDAEKNSFEMMQKTGVLPTAVKEIYYSLQETRPVDKAISGTATRTREEMIANIEELLIGGRVIPKAIEDDIVIMEKDNV